MLVFFLVLLSCLPAALAESGLSLPVAIQQFREANPDLRAARAQIAAAAGRAAQSRLWPNPELEVAAEDMPVDGGLAQSKTMIGIAQTVPFPGKKTLDGRIGRQEVVASEWEYRAKERELVREVTLAFYAVLAGEKKTAVAEELLALAESSADSTRKRVRAGAAADQEELRAEIELERAATELISARTALAEARRTLGRWLGRNDAGPLQGELPETVVLEPVSLPPDGQTNAHPQLAAAAAQRERAELEWRRARLEPLPDITLGVASGRDRATDETLLEFRVSLPLPLFDRAQGRRNETRALAQTARYQVTATEQRLAMEWDLARARVQAAQSQADAYRTRILPKAEEALKRVRDGYDAGKFGFLDLLDTQRTTFEVRLAYYDKLLELNSAAAELAALAGKKEPNQ